MQDGGGQCRIEFSESDFEFFKSECRKWIQVLGLDDWQVGFIFGTVGDDSIAQVAANYCARKAHVYFATSLQDCNEALEPRNAARLIRGAARHEMLELMLMPMQVMAKNRKWDGDAYESETHAVIHRLEKLMDFCTAGKDAGKDRKGH